MSYKPKRLQEKSYFKEKYIPKRLNEDEKTIIYNFGYNPKRLEYKRRIVLNQRNAYYVLAFLATLNISYSIILVKSANLNKNEISYSNYEHKSFKYSNINLVNNDELIELFSEDGEVVIEIDVYAPENLDFSDFPYSDGTRESKVRIANYIREMLKDIPNEYKYDYILEHFMFTPDEFKVFCAVLYKESKSGRNRYIDAFACTTSVFNRCISDRKSGYVRSWEHLSGPVSLYQHITASGQYSPYVKGTYKSVLGIIDDESYQAILDCLFVIDYMPERMHDYLDFRANGYSGYQFVTGGNAFRFHQPSYDIIPLEERYYYVEEIEEEKTLEKEVLTRHLG